MAVSVAASEVEEVFLANSKQNASTVKRFDKIKLIIYLNYENLYTETHDKKWIGLIGGYETN